MSEEWRIWGGEYKTKQFYEVKTDEGEYLCWPNGGVLCVVINISGKREEGKLFEVGGDFLVRKAKKHPLDYLSVDRPY